MSPEMINLESFTALVTLAIAAGLIIITHRVPKTGPARAARNHLTEFSRAWSLLAGYYILRLALPFLNYPADVRIMPYDPTSPFWAFVYHMIVLSVCTATNFYLRRAILELEIVYEGPDPDIIRRSFLTRANRHLTDEGILASFILSTATLLVPILVLPGSYSKVFISVSYALQLLVSSALFLRLAASYRHFKKGQLAAILALLYGVLQLFYPFYVEFHFTIYEYVLTIAKMSLACSIGTFALVMTDLSNTAQDILSLKLSNSPTDSNALDRLAVRSEVQARLRKMFQACLTITALLVLGTLIWQAYIYSIDLARRANFSPSSITLIRILWLSPTLFALQAIFYFFILRLSFKVKWAEHANGALADLLEIQESKSYVAKWEKLTISRKGSHASDKSPAVQVILLHGIFSSGTRCWGFLPAIFLDCGQVSRVHLLTYKHNLWSPKKRLYQIKEELATILRALVNSSQEKTVIFAHSLGGLLIMRTLSWMMDNNSKETLEKIKHLVCVATPLTGSRHAVFAWPWSWPSSLKRGAKFTNAILEDFTKQFVPAGYITGEEEPLCSCSFFYGTQDDVAGSDVKILGLTGRRVSVPSWHSAGAVYFKTSPLAALYLEELTPASRSVQLMRIIASNLIGRRLPQLALIFETEKPGDLGRAKVWETLEENWDNTLQNSGDKEHRGKALSEILQRHFLDAQESISENWTAYWDQLRSMFGVAYQQREPIVTEWPEEMTLYLFANQEAGFAFVARENHRFLEG